VRATPHHEDHGRRNANRETAVAQIFPPIQLSDNCIEAIETWAVHGSFELRPQSIEVMTIRLPLKFRHFVREAIVRDAPEQLKLSKHFNRVVEEIRCNLQVVERCEATGKVVFERSIQEVVRILNTWHRTKSMGYQAIRGPGEA
jgi:hypothetical protein